MIRRNFIEESDIGIYSYNDLLDEVLERYEYRTIIIAIDNIIKHYKFNKYKDENEEDILNKFSYFKTSLINNLDKITNGNIPEWFNL